MKQQKKKLFDRTTAITTAVCLLPLVFGAMLYPRLPERVATHWNFAGQADHWAPKYVAVWLLPVIHMVLNLVLHAVVNSDPRRANQPPALTFISKWIPAVTALFTQPMLLLAAVDESFPKVGMVTTIVGVLLIVTGNYLPKCRYNYTLGIKLPWTLADEDNWDRTHRFAGWVYLAAGVLLAGGGLIGNWWFCGIALALVLVVPAGYSFWLTVRKG